MTELVLSASLKTPQKPFGCFCLCLFFKKNLSTAKLSDWIKMNRRGLQVRSRGSLLKASPVFVVGVVVIVIILCVYLEMMLTFPW